MTLIDDVDDDCDENFCYRFPSRRPCADSLLTRMIDFYPGDPADQVLQVVPRDKEHQRTGRSNQVPKLKYSPRNFFTGPMIIFRSRILPEIVRQRRGFGADKRGERIYLEKSPNQIVEFQL